jgi:hypothetical protein
VAERTRLCLAAWLAGLLLGGTASADVFFLRDGDRVTGKLVSQTARSFRVQTSYGRLLIPKSRVERWRRSDGKEVVLNPPAPGTPILTPVPVQELPPPRLVLVVLGTTFWHAWDRRDAPRDPSLRLEVRLDEEVVATFTDATLDPDDLPGAVVNTFSFLPSEAQTTTAPRVEGHPAEIQPGRIVLKLDLPPGGAPQRRVRVAYQKNEGTVEEPAWRDVATSSAMASLSPDTPAITEIRQGRGQMDFGGFPRRRMKKVETFALELGPSDSPGSD